MPPEPAPPGLLALLRESITTPQKLAARLMRWGLPPGTVVELVVLLCVLDALLVGMVGGGRFVLPVSEDEMLTLGPLAHAVLLFVSLTLSAGAIQVAGQMLGGRGRLTEALLLMGWLEVVGLAIQVVQALILLLLPPLAGPAALAGLGIMLWCLVHFVRELHGFDGYGRTIATLLLALVALAIGLTLLLGPFIAPLEAAHV